MNAEDLSRYEFCPRFPALYRVYDPRLLPIREATRRYFERGVRQHFAGETDNPATIRREFIEEAAYRGYEYPEGEPYVIAQDHADWLECVLHLLPAPAIEPLPIISLGSGFVDVDGYYAGSAAVLLRVVHSYDERPKWPELILAGRFSTIHIWQFRLPSVASDGRLPSPGCMAYAQPMTKELRLAKFDGSSFPHTWKRTARWEIQPPVQWPEWKLGIDRDKCIDQIYRVIEFDQSGLEPEQIESDAIAIAESVWKPQPRLREHCRSCMFERFCHGGPDGKRYYLSAGGKAVQEVQGTETD